MNYYSTGLSRVTATVCGFALIGVCFSLTAGAQSEWKLDYLPDGQPNITGMWNNVGATATPLEMPEQFQGRVPNEEELAKFIQDRDERRKRPMSFEGGLGYANYWMDWYWSDAEVDAPALVVAPPMVDARNLPRRPKP